MLPPGLNAGGSAASLSAVVPGRTPSSVSTVTAPLRAGTVTGTISAASRPSLIAAAALAWDSAAKASWSARLMPSPVWSRSVAAPMEMPSNPQMRPSRSRASASVAAPYLMPLRLPGSRWGAFVIDSVPPATTISL